MQVQFVVYSAPKEGCAPGEWEDGAGDGSFLAHAAHGGDVPWIRFAVADGATETYESGRWVNQLIGSFMSPDQASAATWPDFDHGSISAWFKAMQEQWQAVARPAGD